MTLVLGLVTLVGLIGFALKSLGDLLVSNRPKGLTFTALLVGLLLLIFVVGGASLSEIVSGRKMERVLEMLGTVFLSVFVCVGVWVLLNLFVAQMARGWRIFSAILGAVLGAGFFGLLRGNRSVLPIFAEEDPFELLSGGGWLGRAEWPVIGALLFGVAFAAIAAAPNKQVRAAIGVVAGIVAGALLANYVKLWHRPAIDWVETLIATAVVGGIGAAIGVRKNALVRYALLGAGLGFAFGAWALAPFGRTIDAPWIAAIVPMVLIMAGIGWGSVPTERERAQLESRAQAAVFLAPALIFLTIALVVPAIRTGILSFKDRDSELFVGLDNYTELFTAENSFDTSNWADMFTSRLFFVAMVLVVIGVLVGLITGIRRNGSASYESGPTSVGALLLAVFLFSFAALSVLRGTFFNNLWWVLTVVSVATALGLAIAVLADRATFGEKAAKSLIFMPMAISFVGASIVWRLQYQARDIRKNQTGVLNAVWVELGRLSNSGAPRIMIMIVLAGLLALGLLRIVRRVQADQPFTLAAITTFSIGWLLYRFAGPRLGGFQTVNGETLPDTVLFLTERPFNNVFLMIILIWMQVGFAMVIFSAAIKAVPAEFIEAAEVDGATESQTFFNVTLPTILPTVGVVVTTMIVQVTKVFDIVSVAGGGGKFGNNVLANQMFDESFNIGNIGFGATIAMVMFAMVLPVMIYNILNMQKGAA